MLDILAFLCIPLALIILAALCIIDLKHWILPDELNLALGICGIAFHFLTAYEFLNIGQMAMGAAIGAGFLYIIRFFANRYYDRDTLGLGDVKLLGAAGLWLGVDGTLEAITIGAAAGLVHGLVYAACLAIKTKSKFSVSQLSIPAGPGFAVGIVAAGYFMLGNYVMGMVHELFA